MPLFFYLPSLSGHMKKIKYILLFAALIAYLLYSSDQSKYLHVYFLDIDQGDAGLIRTPDGVNILVDAGPDNKILYQVAQSLPWYERQIDYVIISHWHEDHFGGLIALQQKYKIGQILVNGHEPDSLLYSIWRDSAQQAGIKIQAINIGQTFSIDHQTSWQILYTSPTSSGDYNDTSVVLKFSFGKTDLLFTGDLPAEQESVVISSGLDISAEILKVGHHGSRYSSSAAFLSKIDPELCVIQSGQDNKFGHPHQEALDRLSASGCRVIGNQEYGRIEIRSDGEQWWLARD